MFAIGVVKAMSVLAPMVAPIAGAAILQVAEWRETFWVLAVIGAWTLIIAFMFQETLSKEERFNGSLGASLYTLAGRRKKRGVQQFSLNWLPAQLWQPVLKMTHGFVIFCFDYISCPYNLTAMYCPAFTGA